MALNLFKFGRWPRAIELTKQLRTGPPAEWAHGLPTEAEEEHDTGVEAPGAAPATKSETLLGQAQMVEQTNVLS